METCDYVLYPDEVKELIGSNCSFDFTNTGQKGEDLDFKLEVVNKQSKSWNSGVPNFETWLKIFRNLDKLDNLKKAFLLMSGIASEQTSVFNEPEQSTMHKTNEVKAWRTHLRTHNYLSSPKIDDKFTSVSGDILDQGLLKFTDTAISNRTLFYDSVIASGNLSNATKLSRVCVTMAEKSCDASIYSQTKDQIRSHICTAIDNINDLSLKDFFQSKLDSIYDSKKQNLIDLYNEIVCDDTNDECVEVNE